MVLLFINASGHLRLTNYYPIQPHIASFNSTPNFATSLNDDVSSAHAVYIRLDIFRILCSSSAAWCTTTTSVRTLDLYAIASSNVLLLNRRKMKAFSRDCQMNCRVGVALTASARHMWSVNLVHMHRGGSVYINGKCYAWSIYWKIDWLMQCFSKYREFAVVIKSVPKYNSMKKHSS